MFPTPKIAIALLLFITITYAIYHILDKSDQITHADIDLSIKRAQHYLKQVYSDEYIYEDSYVKCLNALKCDPRFKKIDVSIDLVWIGNEVEEHSTIDYQIKNADMLLKKESKLLESEPMFTDGGMFIGDLHCILASMYNNTKLITEIEALAKPYGWADRSIFNEKNLHKKIAYESWCVMLLAEKGSNKSHAIILSEQILNETLNSIQDNRFVPLSKTSNAIHTLLLFKKLDEFGYDIEPYKKSLKILQHYMTVAADDKSLIGDSNVQSMILYTLADYNYSRAETQKIARRLLERQDNDGGWDQIVYKKGDDAKAFTTLRVILALNKYKLQYLK